MKRLKVTQVNRAIASISAIALIINVILGEMDMMLNSGLFFGMLLAIPHEEVSQTQK